MSTRDPRRLLARVYLSAIGATALVTLVVLAVGGQAVRGWLGFPFTGVPASAAQAAAIFANNARIMVAAFGAAAAVNAPWLAAQGQSVTPGAGWKATRLLCDLTVGIGVGANVVVVGAALGAYQARMLAAVLPHGPVELLGFACAITLYLLARRGPVPTRTWLLLTATATVALAAGAILETFVPWGSGVR
jgi:hypothetical protein